MATCQFCKRDVIEVVFGETRLLLDEHYKAYAAGDMEHIFPVDGDKVFLSRGLVEHWVVCPKQRSDQAKAQSTYRAQHPAKGTPR